MQGSRAQGSTLGLRGWVKGSLSRGDPGCWEDPETSRAGS